MSPFRRHHDIACLLTRFNFYLKELLQMPMLSLLQNATACPGPLQTSKSIPSDFARLAAFCPEYLNTVFPLISAGSQTRAAPLTLRSE